VFFALGALGLCGLSVRAAATPIVDYAESRHAQAWLRHPVYGDPSFDAFERMPGNPIHRGAPPFEWPVNGFLFTDPVSGNWYVYIGDYGKGYMRPPSRCLLYRSSDRGETWTNLGVVLHGDTNMFDRGGHTPDAGVVYADNRYHMVYDWGTLNFNEEGGLAYAWAEKPEGPWHRAEQPITRNTTLPKLLGRYQRTYSATLLRRAHDWLILAMMDDAPHGWAMFAITAPNANGPYGERRLVRNVEADYYHPPLMEFMAAFVHGDYVYAPATSVALNRNFNVIFRAPLERADDPAAWSIFEHGSVWHSEDVENEFYGIWGQNFSGAVSRNGVLRVMFPSRDALGRGTINMAERPWDKPLLRSGFVLTGHSGPSLTLLRDACDNFTLDTKFRLRGCARLLLDYGAPLNPDAPAADATLHPIMNTRNTAVEFAPGEWKILQAGPTGRDATVATGTLARGDRFAVHLEKNGDALELKVNHHELWNGQLPTDPPLERTSVLGWRVETNTYLRVEKFRLRGEPRPARVTFGHLEALLGAADAPSDWEAQSGPTFRFGIGAVSRKSNARAKWNFLGNRAQLWLPRGPKFGQVELRLDGQQVAMLDLHAEEPAPSSVVWESPNLPEDCHALVLISKSGRLPLDSLDVTANAAGSR
jgi:hypothetical protein